MKKSFRRPKNHHRIEGCFIKGYFNNASRVALVEIARLDKDGKVAELEVRLCAGSAETIPPGASPEEVFAIQKRWYAGKKLKVHPSKVVNVFIGPPDLTWVDADSFFSLTGDMAK